jgi:thioesterase domain-containing protein/acyl carrier protein
VNDAGANDAIERGRGGRDASLSIQLRAFLANRLPDYMQPAAFCTLDALPLTTNGKLDLNALPAVEFRSAGSTFEPPRTPTETALSDIWGHVLGSERIGRNDDFFALGGHSLSAMQLVAAVNSRFATELPLKILFERPTIAHLAAAIDTDAAAIDRTLVAFRPTGTRAPLFCIHPAGGHVFCYAPLVERLDADQPVYGIAARALEPGGRLEDSIEALAADYVRAIRAVAPAGPYRLLGMSSGGLVAFEMARQLRAANEAVDMLALLDTSVPNGEANPLSEADLVHGLAVELGMADLIDATPAGTSLEALLERGWTAGRIPRELDLAAAERIAAVYRNSVELARAYRPQPTSLPVVVFRALHRDGPDEAPPDWSAYVGAQSTCIDLACTHAELMSKPLAPVIASHLEPLLRRHDHGTSD